MNEQLQVLFGRLEAYGIGAWEILVSGERATGWIFVALSLLVAAGVGAVCWWLLRLHAVEDGDCSAIKAEKKEIRSVTVAIGGFLILVCAFALIVNVISVVCPSYVVLKDLLQ